MIDPLTALLMFGGTAISAISAGQAASQQSASAKKQAETQQQMSEEQLQFQREGAVLGMEAGLEEQRRRQQEAAFRAGKLEDVVGLFEGLQGPQFQAVSPMSIQAQQVATPAAISAERVGAQTLGESMDVGAMRDIAQQLAAEDSGVDLRRAAMRELEMGGESLNAMLAAQGVRGSGFGAMQARGMTGDVMAGLARDISQQRMQALTGAASIYQGAGGLSTQREMANQDALLRAALANQQAGLSADIATGEMGMQTALANQAAMLDAARANQVAELQAAGMNMEQAQAVADFNMRRTTEMGAIYQDEAFGANAPLDLSRSENLLQEYRRRWNVPGGNYGDGAGGQGFGHMGMRVPMPEQLLSGIEGMMGGGPTLTPTVEPKPTRKTTRSTSVTPTVEPRVTPAVEPRITPAVEPRREVARSTAEVAREREDTPPTRSINRRNINETPAPRSSTRTPPPPPRERNTSRSDRVTAAVQPRSANTFIPLDGKKTTTDSSKRLTSGTSSSNSKPKTIKRRRVTTGTQGRSGTTTSRSTTSRSTSSNTTLGRQGGNTSTRPVSTGSNASGTRVTSTTGASLTPGPSTKKVTSAPSKTTSTHKRFFTRGR